MQKLFRNECDLVKFACGISSISTNLCQSIGTKVKMTKTKLMSPPSMAELSFAKSLPSDMSAGGMIDHNNNEEKPTNGIRQISAVSFKYRSNASRQDLDDLRRLLTELRLEQADSMDPVEHKFYEPDYQRMMADDWLVTRFLLKGKKAFEKAAESGHRHEILNGTHDEQLCSGMNHLQLDRHATLKQSIELVKKCARFRFDYRINNQTCLDEFPSDWVKTNGLFNYKPDVNGNPTIYLRVALHRPKLIGSPEARHLFKRYMLYNVERCDQDLYNKPGKAICCVFDMTNVALENIDLELTTWMINSFKSASPKLICYVIIYNPPWFFTATFRVICNTLLSDSKRQSVKFASGNEILNYIDRNNLPPFMRMIID